LIGWFLLFIVCLFHFNLYLNIKYFKHKCFAGRSTAAMEKGILGIKKDPKNQMLFSFVVRNGEEWPSSDSGDSDYGPGCKR
jgi:hypothetical protein